MPDEFVNDQKPCGVTIGHDSHWHTPEFGGGRYRCHGAFDADSHKRDQEAIEPTALIPPPWRLLGEIAGGGLLFAAPVGTPNPFFPEDQNDKESL